MIAKDKIPAPQQRESSALENSRTEAPDDSYAPRNLTFAENAILTIKVLAGAGLVIAAIWGLSLWTSAT
jgi:hypothetical protein